MLKTLGTSIVEVFGLLNPSGTLMGDATTPMVTSQGTLLAGEDLTANRMLTEVRGSAVVISTATTTVAKTGAGHINGITITGGTLGNITIYDNTAASGTVLANFDNTATPGPYPLNVPFTIGCTIVTSAATKLTASIR